MDKLKVSDAVAYLDMLSGILCNLSQTNTVMNNKPVVFCNPDAFVEMADNLKSCSRTIREELLGEEEKK